MSSVWKALAYLSVLCVCFRWVGKCHPSWLGVERTAVINVIQYSVRVQFFSIVSKLSCSSWCVCIRIQMRFAHCTRWALHLVDMTPEPLTFFHVIYSGRRLSHLSSRVSGFGWLHLCDDVPHSVQGSRSVVVGGCRALRSRARNMPTPPHLAVPECGGQVVAWVCAPPTGLQEGWGRESMADFKSITSSTERKKNQWPLNLHLDIPHQKQGFVPKIAFLKNSWALQTERVLG